MNSYYMKYNILFFRMIYHVLSRKYTIKLILLGIVKNTLASYFRCYLHKAYRDFIFLIPYNVEILCICDGNIINQNTNILILRTNSFQLVGKVNNVKITARKM